MKVTGKVVLPIALGMGAVFFVWYGVLGFHSSLVFPPNPSAKESPIKRKGKGIGKPVIPPISGVDAAGKALPRKVISKAKGIVIPKRPKGLLPPSSMEIISRNMSAKEILDHPYFSWIRKHPPLGEDRVLCREIERLLLKYKYNYKKNWKEIVNLAHSKAIEMVDKGYPLKKPGYYKGRVQPVYLAYKNFSGKVELTRENAPDVFARYSVMERWTDWFIRSVEKAILRRLEDLRGGGGK